MRLLMMVLIVMLSSFLHYNLKAQGISVLIDPKKRKAISITAKSGNNKFGETATLKLSEGKFQFNASFLKTYNPERDVMPLYFLNVRFRFYDSEGVQLPIGFAHRYTYSVLNPDNPDGLQRVSVDDIDCPECGMSYSWEFFTTTQEVDITSNGRIQSMTCEELDNMTVVGEVTLEDIFGRVRPTQLAECHDFFPESCLKEVNDASITTITTTCDATPDGPSNLYRGEQRARALDNPNQYTSSKSIPYLHYSGNLVKCVDPIEKYTIYNLQGKLIQEESRYNQKTLNTSNLTNGVYIIVVSTHHNSYTNHIKILKR